MLVLYLLTTKIIRVVPYLSAACIIPRVNGNTKCAQIVRGGRTYSRRLYDLCARVKPGRAIFLDDETKKDLQWWRQFCDIFNCRALMRKTVHNDPMVSDASTRGFGAWSGDEYFYGVWEGYAVPSSVNKDFQVAHPVMDNIKVHKKNINVYELWPVIVGLQRWVHKYTNCKVDVVTDNMQVLAMINTGRSKNRLCMEWLRELFWTCFIHNIELHASYINTKDSILADHLSRLPYRGVPDKCDSYLKDTNMPSLFSQ